VVARLAYRIRPQEGDHKDRPYIRKVADIVPAGVIFLDPFTA
jgi:hypothetical protein